MIDLSTFTAIHTALSLLALVVGILVVLGLPGSHRMPGLTALYLATSVATSLTGFVFPTERFLPSHGVGVISLVLLLTAILGRYVFYFAGAWRWIYAVGVVLSVYFLFFVGIVQAFMKVPSLSALAPTQSEPPFAITQGACLVIFIVLTIVAARRFRP
jgi:hypothetical protein